MSHSWKIKDGVMLAHTLTDPKSGNIRKSPKGYPQAPDGWLVSEKFDGYRAIWDTENFLSRTGKIFHAPEWFKRQMPTDVVLDGELFIGRGRFEECGILRKKVPVDSEWEKVRYLVFDSPAMSGTFEQRLLELSQVVESLNCSQIELVEHQKVHSLIEMTELFNSLTNDGAEGIMLRAPGSPYECKRSHLLLKVKQLFDTECVIKGYKPGTGKYTGMLGSFHCEWNGIEFDLSGMSDEIRTNYETSHPIGTVVTFTYMGVSKTGVPRHPNYLRKRT